ncbi:hypothetical protein BLOT_016072 [Blomia tropicalis]|nr:hypothetical protein BLOT_016072 [Blomia tropicalis]
MKRRNVRSLVYDGENDRDELGIKGCPEEVVHTRSQILSYIGRNYDPMGFLDPLSVKFLEDNNEKISSAANSTQ